MTPDELKSWQDNGLKNIHPIEDIQSYAMSGGEGTFVLTAEHNRILKERAP